jgi:hypothetical protein
MGIKILGINEVGHQSVDDNSSVPYVFVKRPTSTPTYSVYLPSAGCVNMQYFYQAAFCQVGNILYIFSGYDSSVSSETFKQRLIVVHLDTWKVYEEEGMTNTPSARAEATMGHIDGKLYVVGGTTASASVNEVWEYDIATKVWTELSSTDPFPSTTSFTNSSRIAHAYNNKLYFSCGSVDGSLSNGIWSFDPFAEAGSKWTTLTPNASVTARIYYGLAIYEDKLYIIGGRNATGTTSPEASVWMYDITNDTWTRKANLVGWNSNLSTTGGVMYHNAWTIGKKIYVHDGFTYENNYNRWVEEYDVISNTWTRKGPTRQDRYLCASAVYNGSIYTLAGKGYSATTTGHSAHELIYNPGLGRILLAEV